MSSPPSSLTLVAINVQVFSALLLARPQYPLRSVAVQRLPLPPVCSCPRLVPFLPLAPLAPLLLLLLQPCLSRAPAELHAARPLRVFELPLSSHTARPLRVFDLPLRSRNARPLRVFELPLSSRTARPLRVFSTSAHPDVAQAPTELAATVGSLPSSLALLPSFR